MAIKIPESTKEWGVSYELCDCLYIMLQDLQNHWRRKKSEFIETGKILLTYQFSLQYPDFTKRFFNLTSDASNITLGATFNWQRSDKCGRVTHTQQQRGQLFHNWKGTLTDFLGYQIFWDVFGSKFNIITDDSRWKFFTQTSVTISKVDSKIAWPSVVILPATNDFSQYSTSFGLIRCTSKELGSGSYWMV